ncbi:MAG: hypothetical protein V1875_05830 [Candidatus Altiarchaeota archaeon]
MGRLVCISVILLLSQLASAAEVWKDCQSTYMFDGGRTVSEAKSSKDGLFLEMPDNAAVLELVTVKIYVNDPFIKKNANLVEFLCDPGSCAISSSGKEMDYDSGYPFTNMPYSGEGVIELKMRNSYTDAQKSGINYLGVRFIQLKAPLAAGEYDKCQAEANKNGTAWYQFQCQKASPYKKLCGQEKCDVAFKRVGMVAKEFKSHLVQMESKPPATATNKPSSSAPIDDVYQSKYDSYQATTPSGKQQYCSRGLTIGIYPNVAMESVKQLEANYGANAKKYAPTNPPGGLAAGKSFEIYERDAVGTPTCDHIGCGELFDYDIGYTLIGDMQPEGTGTIRVTVSKKDCVAKSALKSEIDKTVAETKAFLASYRQKAATPQDFKGPVCSDVKATPTEPGTLTGRITDGHDHPMPYMKLTLEVAGMKTVGYTDEAGNYEFKDVKGLKPDDKNPPEATLKAEMSYWRDGKNYFTILYGNDVKYLTKEFKLESERDLQQDIDFKLQAPQAAKKAVIGGAKYETNYFLYWLADIAPIYYHMSDTVDFYLTIVGAKIDYKLPVEVNIEVDKGTWYDMSYSGIVIKASDAAYNNLNRPKNREYHEFAHHVMYVEYGDWPDGRNLPDVVPHKGYLNPSTGDSWVEGFAEFMAMANAEYTNLPENQPPEKYASFGSLETNLKVWQWNGFSEEFSIAGYLWDLHDKNNDEGDTISLSLQQMWPIMKVKRKDFYEYHKAFKQAFPSQANVIDQIAINHGLWADTNRGNGRYDADEPHRDGSSPRNNSRYDAGEYFIDYPFNWTHETNEVVGKATNYQRGNRSMAGYIPDAFIKVEDTKVWLYKVQVHFNNPAQGTDYEYETENRGGLIYLMPLPEDVEGTITLSPNSQDYTSVKPYTITVSEYRRKYYESEGNGFFDKHNFELKSKGTKNDPVPMGLQGSKPEWFTDGGYDVKGPPPTMKSRDSGGSTGGFDAKTICPCLPLLPMILAGLISVVAKARLGI